MLVQDRKTLSLLPRCIGERNKTKTFDVDDLLGARQNAKFYSVQTIKAEIFRAPLGGARHAHF